MNQALRIIAATWLLAGVTPFAHGGQCQPPTAPADVPSGATATRAEMLREQRALRTFDKSLDDYRLCLLGEVSQATIGRTDEEARAMREELLRPHRELWVKLTWMTACYNDELKSFRATGGGSQSNPADCTGYVPPALNAGSAANDSAPAALPAPLSPSPPTSGAAAQIVNVTATPNAAPDFAAQAIPHGAWAYRLVRGQRLEPCRYRGNPECIRIRLEFENRSTRVIECQAQAALDGSNDAGVSRVETQGVVVPGKIRTILSTLLLPATTVASSTASCKEREPLPRMDTPPECRFQVTRPVSVPEYYPALSRRLGEEGPVAIQFTLAEKEGRATSIHVIGSSLFDRLDAAAVKAVGDIGFSTTCPGKDYRIQLAFSLD